MGLADAPEATPSTANAETAGLSAGTTEPPAPPTRPEPVAAAAAIPDGEPDPAVGARLSALAAEVERLRASVAAQETAAAASRDRLRTLGMLGGGALVVAILALLVALIR
jgi:hypothetical protein